jgi:DNA-binding response OmpR family regulator
VIVPKILVFGERPQFRILLSESLCFDGHLVESVGDAAMLRDHLDNSPPDLVLLDAGLDGFGAMQLLLDLKEQFIDLAVMVYQCRDYGDVDRIKGAVAEALESNTAKMLCVKGTTIDN